VSFGLIVVQAAAPSSAVADFSDLLHEALEEHAK